MCGTGSGRAGHVCPPLHACTPRSLAGTVCSTIPVRFWVRGEEIEVNGNIGGTALEESQDTMLDCNVVSIRTGYVLSYGCKPVSVRRLIRITGLTLRLQRYQLRARKSV